MTKQERVEKLANCQICYAQFGKCKLYDRTTCSDYKEALYIYRKQKEIVKEFAEELKKCTYCDNSFPDGKWHRYIFIEDIDELLKEYEE